MLRRVKRPLSVGKSANTLVNRQNSQNFEIDVQFEYHPLRNEHILAEGHASIPRVRKVDSIEQNQLCLSFESVHGISHLAERGIHTPPMCLIKEKSYITMYTSDTISITSTHDSRICVPLIFIIRNILAIVSVCCVDCTYSIVVCGWVFEGKIAFGCVTNRY